MFMFRGNTHTIWSLVQPSLHSDRCKLQLNMRCWVLSQVFHAEPQYTSAKHALLGSEHVFHAEPLYTSAKHALCGVSRTAVIERDGDVRFCFFIRLDVNDDVSVDEFRFDCVFQPITDFVCICNRH